MLLDASVLNSEIQQLEERLLQAMRLGELSFLGKIFSRKYIFLGSDGSTWGKERLMEDFCNPNFKLSKIDVHNRLIFMHDNSAIVTGISTIEGKIDKTPLTGKYRFMRVWNKENDGWKIIAVTTSNAENALEN
ncbi:nuclear transport factor 2 family protein [candidate division KSB1 bacterium]|nr:nuclear transport factor 2 family protein [candidate division KSB1 bacterium]